MNGSKYGGGIIPTGLRPVLPKLHIDWQIVRSFLNTTTAILKTISGLDLKDLKERAAQVRLVFHP